MAGKKGAAGKAKPGRRSARTPEVVGEGAGALHRATLRVLQIQEHFARNPRSSSTLTELSRLLRIPKSSLLAILRTLSDHGYLEIANDGDYRLAPKAIEMSRDVWLQSPMQGNLLDLAHGRLEEVQRNTGETAFLAVPTSNGTEVIYVDQVESHQLIRYSGGLGEHRPVYCTAAGLAYLAALPESDFETYVRGVNPIPLTPRTVTSRDMLRTRVDEIRKTGIAVSVEEYATGASAIGVAVRGSNGRPLGAISVVGPTDRILGQRERIGQSVVDAATALTASLRISEPAPGNDSTGRS